MDPAIWGPHLWKYLNCLSLSYPINPTKEEIQNHYMFIMYMGKTLPCPNCRENFKSHLKIYPLTKKTLSSRSNFIQWIIDMHNCVNDECGKELLSYKDAIMQMTQGIADG